MIYKSEKDDAVDIQNLQKKIDGIEPEIQALDKKDPKFISKRATLYNKRSLLKKEIENLKAQQKLTTTTSDLEWRDRAIRAVADQNAIFREKISLLETSVSNLEANVSSLESINASLLIDKQNNSDKINELITKLSEAQNKLSSLNNGIVNQNELISVLKAEASVGKAYSDFIEWLKFKHPNGYRLFCERYQEFMNQCNNSFKN